MNWIDSIEYYGALGLIAWAQVEAAEAWAEWVEAQP